MKYVRTKDGIFKVIKDDHPHYVHVEMKYTPGVMLHESVIEKSADSIDELCDECVMESKDHSYRTLLMKLYDDKISFFDSFMKDVKSELLNYSRNRLQKGFAIYGAIWTDKGLKYVAKMNEKGELELL